MMLAVLALPAPSSAATIVLLILQLASGQVALSRAGASLINVYGSAPASNCIDSNLNTFCHSLMDQTDPWLEIDLGSSQSVATVRLDNRADCCQTH